MSAQPSSVDLKGLIWTLVRTDFKARYHGTAMGFLWALLKPATMFLVLLGVFSFIFAKDPHYKLNLIIGLFLWDFFAEGTKVGLTSLHAKGYLVSKTRVPRWILVVASPANAAFTMLVIATALITTLCVTGHAPGLIHIGLFIWVLLQLILIVVGFSLATGALFLGYRDLNQIWEVLVLAGFFVAPIFYPLAVVPERFHFYFYIWPPTPIIQFARMLLIEGRIPTARALAYLALETGAIVVIGLSLFRRYAPRAAEHL